MVIFCILDYKFLSQLDIEGVYGSCQMREGIVKKGHVPSLLPTVLYPQEWYNTLLRHMAYVCITRGVYGTYEEISGTSEELRGTS